MKQSRTIIAITGTLWLAAITGGFFAIMSYQFAPGKEARAPHTYPEGAVVQLADDRHTLIMLAHPLCPCTKASISELRHLMLAQASRLKAYVLFLEPKDPPAGWQVDSPLKKDAESIPGVNIVCDTDGLEARRLKAVTSGQTVVYDKDGKLVFQGGITASRGQVGRNSGVNAIIAILDGQQDNTSDLKTSFVFGCPLEGPVAK